jgi:hypothetical protein
VCPGVAKVEHAKVGGRSRQGLRCLPGFRGAHQFIDLCDEARRADRDQVAVAAAAHGVAGVRQVELEDVAHHPLGHRRRDGVGAATQLRRRNHMHRGAVVVGDQVVHPRDIAQHFRRRS